MSPKLKQTIKWIWLSLIVIAVSTYIINPSIFTNEAIATFISRFSGYIWTAYFFIHLIRGFVLLPSTPLIFAGVILFPNQLIWVLVISLLGILGSSLIIYYCSDKLGLSSLFNIKNKKLKLIEEKLLGENGFFYILIWSFLPIVPTDAICYVSGALRIKLTVFISALFLGELILCSIYIFGSSMFIN